MRRARDEGASRSGWWPRLLAAAAVLAIVVCSAAPATGQAQRDRPPELWEEVPLERGERAQEPPGRAAEPAGDDGEGLAVPVAVTIGLAGVALGFCVARLLERRRGAAGVAREARQPGPAPALVAAPPPAAAAPVPAATTSTSLEAGARPSVRRLAGLFVALAAVAAVEVVVAAGELLWAQIAAAVLVILLVNAGRRRSAAPSPDGFDPVAAALQGLALVPLVRVAGMGLPLGEMSDAAGQGTLAIAIGLAAVAMAPAVGVRVRGVLGVPSPLRLWLTAAGGLALGCGAYLAGAPALVARGDGAAAVAVALASATTAGIALELVFRGVVQIGLQRVAGGLGAVAASCLFACGYLAFGSASLVLVMGLAGLLFAHSVASRGVLGAALVGHVLLAAGAAVAWPLLLGPEAASSLPEPAASWALALVAIVGAVALARRPVARVARPQVVDAPPSDPWSAWLRGGEPAGQREAHGGM